MFGDFNCVVEVFECVLFNMYYKCVDYFGFNFKDFEKFGLWVVDGYG